MATKKRSAKPARKRSTAKAPAAKKKTAAPAKKKTGAKKKRAKAKSAAPRVTPKVSLLKGTNLDDWARKLNGWQADALKIIRALVTRQPSTCRSGSGVAQS